MCGRNFGLLYKPMQLRWTRRSSGMKSFWKKRSIACPIFIEYEGEIITNDGRNFLQRMLALSWNSSQWRHLSVCRTVTLRLLTLLLLLPVDSRSHWLSTDIYYSHVMTGLTSSSPTSKAPRRHVDCLTISLSVLHSVCHQPDCSVWVRIYYCKNIDRFRHGDRDRLGMWLPHF